MKSNTAPLRAMTVVFVIATTFLATAATNVWTGASNLVWSVGANWAPPGPPNATAEARLFDLGSAASPTVTENVTNDTTINRLWLGQTNNAHNIQISPGVTLTIAGNEDNGWGPLGSDPSSQAPDPLRFHSTIYVGTKTFGSGSTQIVLDRISGAGGKLVVSNLNNEILIRQFHSSGAAHRAILDLSALDTFIAKLGRIRVGDGEAQPINRSEGQLYLAKTNNITLVGTNVDDNVQLVVGNNDVNQNQANPSQMILGIQNTLNLDAVLVGGKKQPGLLRGTNGTLSSVKMRASNGTGRTGIVRIGDASDQPQSGNTTTGTFNLIDANSDILADTIVVGKSQSAQVGNGSLSTGNFLVGTGTLDVNTFDLAYRMDGCSAIAAATANVTLSNTTTTVNSLLRFGRRIDFSQLVAANLNITGGSLTVKSNLVTQGTAVLNATNTSIALQSHPSFNASVIVLNATTLSNAAALTVTNTFSVISNGNIIAGNPVFDMGKASTWNMTGIAGGSLTVSNTFQGAGTFNGNLVQAPGATITPGKSGPVGVITLNGNLTLNAGTLQFDLSPSSTGANDRIPVSGTVTLNGTNNVFLTAPGGGYDTASAYTLISSGGGLTGNQNFFTVAGPSAQSHYNFAFDTTSTPNSVKLSVSGGANNLLWVGDGTANNFDLQGAFNWSSGVSTQFFTLDKVTFDDSGSATPAVNIVGQLIPGTTVITNTTKNYTFSGSGGIAISGPLIKAGTGTATFNNSSAIAVNGLTVVSNGSLSFANSGQNVFSGGLSISNGGSLTLGGSSDNFIDTATAGIGIGLGATLTIANSSANTYNANPISLNGTLAFNQSANATLDSVLTGTGALTKDGTGTLTLAGSSPAYNGPVQINGGTIRIFAANALGINSVTVTNSGSLDIDGLALGTLPVRLSGAGPGGVGALVNNAAGIDPTAATATAFVFRNNVTIGGTGPWSSDPVKNLGALGLIATGLLTTSNQPFNLTKVGNNMLYLNGTTVDSALADVNVQQGLLYLRGGTTLGNPANNCTISAGASVSFFDTTTQWDKKFVLIGDGVTENLLNFDGANTIIGQITLNGDSVVGAVDPSRGAPVSLTLAGPIGGTGNLIKSGSDTTILLGTNNYSGTTTVKGGTLLVNGLNQGTGLLTVQSGTLGGTGALSGPVSMSVNGLLQPGIVGGPPSSLNLGGGNLTLNDSTNVFLLNPGPEQCSSVTNINALTVNGTTWIKVSIQGIVPLNAGDTYTLLTFNSSNATTNNVQIVPVTAYTFAVTNTGTSIQLQVLTAASSLTWNGTFQNPRTWDNHTSANWVNNITLAHVTFTNGDFVTFDDSGTNVVNITGSVIPSPEGLVTVDSTYLTPYTFQGPGSIDGTTGMRLAGGGVYSILTILNSNSFSGPIILDNGLLTIGNGGSIGNIGSAGMIATNLNSSFHPTPVVFNRGDSNLVVNGNILTDIAITNLGSGVVTLGGANTFTGGLYVVNGTLRIDNNAALGATNNITVVSNGAALDVGGLATAANGLNEGARQVWVGGSGPGGRGAIINSSTNQQINVLLQVVLLGDTTFGGGNGLLYTNTGNPGRWDIRGATNTAFLSASNNPFNLTKVGSNQISFVAIDFDTNIANIDVQGGIFGFENGTTSMGDSRSNITVRAGAGLEFFRNNTVPNVYTKNFTVTGDGTASSIFNNSGDSGIFGTMSLAGNAVYTINGNFTNGCDLSGGGGITKATNGGTLYLTGTGGYSGNTILLGGRLSLGGSVTLGANPIIGVDGPNAILDLSGAGGSLSLGSGQTLRGQGTVWGAVTAGSSSVVAPGVSGIGVLSVTNSVVLAGGSTTSMEIDPGLGTNDQLSAGTTLQYGGSLVVVTNGNGNLSGGQTFKLFAFGSTPTGTFTSVSLPNISPLSWNTNLLAGTVSVVGAAVTSPTNSAGILSSRLIGTNLVVHGTNNNIPNTAFHYAVMTSTNIQAPLSNWTSIVTNAFDAGGTFDYTNPVTPGSPRLFIDVRAVP